MSPEYHKIRKELLKLFHKNKSVTFLYLTVLLVLAINVYSQEPFPTALKTSKIEGNKTTPKYQNTESKQYQTNSPSADVRKIEAVPPHQKEKDQTKGCCGEAAFKWTDCLLIFFTGVLSVFTALLWWSTDKMWKTTKDTADAAKTSADSYKASERAHLFIDYIEWIKWEPNFTLAEYNRSIASINIVNVGRTPAILVDIGAAVSIKKNNYPTKEDVGRVNIINFPKGVIIKTLGIEPISCQEFIGPSVIHETDFSQSTIICYGFVRYEDIFHNSHEMRFCYEFRPHQSGGRFRISNNKELNDYT